MIARDPLVIGLGVAALAFAAWQALMQEDELILEETTAEAARTARVQEAVERVLANPPPAYRDYSNLRIGPDGRVIGGL